ncbi:hypothetical protein C8J56DRAFT_1168313 [Mycena floridula]|nr:hypothetical protein C8J56DRAFT_1169366 [Mycena floridula]KAJ7582382.1 hypothetical protein C8J56DRAFT_1168313 [Mycena floridula]
MATSLYSLSMSFYQWLTSRCSTRNLLPLVIMSLSPNDLSLLKISDISHSFAKDPANDREFMKFRFRVNPEDGRDSWEVEKTFLELQVLEKHKTHKLEAKAKLWKNCFPLSSMRSRYSGLLHWLQAIVTGHSPKDDNLIIDFLTTDILVPSNSLVQTMQGYLTKKGIFIGWKSRYFILAPPLPDSRCSLEVETAGRRTKQHVLCAQSDAERDHWIDILVESSGVERRTQVEAEYARTLVVVRR